MSRTKNIIPEFTKPELDYIVENANFTEQEKMLFDMRNNEYSIMQCAELLNVGETTAKRIHNRMKSKIMRVIAHMDF